MRLLETRAVVVKNHLVRVQIEPLKARIDRSTIHNEISALVACNGTHPLLLCNRLSKLNDRPSSI